jgi:uncharacterized protein (TIGR02147 family)
VYTNRPYYAVYLQDLLAERSRTNPRYSLRAFARSLSIDAGALSAVLSSKRPLTFKQAEKILTRIAPGPAERKRVLASVVFQQKSRPLLRRDPKVKSFSRANLANQKTRALDLDFFHIVADWYHAAILELTYLPDFKNDVRWIAKTLGITTLEAKAAIARLLELELLENKDGKLQKVNQQVELPTLESTSHARRRKQIQIRQKAIQAIESDPIESRYMSSLTMCIDPALLPEARRRIEEFNDSLCAFLESGSRKEVYAMEIGLFRLQQQNVILGDKK